MREGYQVYTTLNINVSPGEQTLNYHPLSSYKSMKIQDKDKKKSCFF